MRGGPEGGASCQYEGENQDSPGFRGGQGATESHGAQHERAEGRRAGAPSSLEPVLTRSPDHELPLYPRRGSLVRWGLVAVPLDASGSHRRGSLSATPGCDVVAVAGLPSPGSVVEKSPALSRRSAAVLSVRAARHVSLPWPIVAWHS